MSKIPFIVNIILRNYLFAFSDIILTGLILINFHLNHFISQLFSFYLDQALISRSFIFLYFLVEVRNMFFMTETDSYFSKKKWRSETAYNSSPLSFLPLYLSIGGTIYLILLFMIYLCRNVSLS